MVRGVEGCDAGARKCSEIFYCRAAAGAIATGIAPDTQKTIPGERVRTDELSSSSKISFKFAHAQWQKSGGKRCESAITCGRR